MARTDKNQLTHTAGMISEWSPEGSVVELEHAFLILNDIPRGNHAEQWDQVRAALNGNDELAGEEIRANLTRKDYSRQGYWWWNPAEW